MNIPENFDRWMFDYLEGNLSVSEKTSFENFLEQNPNYELESEAWKGAFVSDEAVEYPNQSALIREKKGVVLYLWAAAFAGIIGIGTWFGFYATDHASYKELSANQIDLSSKRFKSFEGSVDNTTNSFTANDDELYVDAENITEGDANDNLIENIEETSNEEYIAYSTRDTEEGSVWGNGENSSANSPDSDVMYVDVIAYTDAENQSTNEERRALIQEKNKLTKEDYGSKYLLNPIEIASDFNLKKKSNVDHNSFSSQMNRIYKKIERSMGYPVGLVNLRDPELIVPENNLLAFNPGFTGGMLRQRFEVNYRNQWSGSVHNSQQLTVSYDNYVHAMRGGFGVMVNAVDYRGGALSEYSLDLLYSPKIKLAKHVVFEPALKVSMGILANNQDKMELNETFQSTRGLILKSADSPELATRNQLWYKDYGLGFVLNTKWFYVGASADNLAGHYANVYAFDSEEPIRTPKQITAVIGADYESVNKSMTISPFVSYRSFASSREVWGGLNYRLKRFMIGGAYSSNGDYTASIGLKMKKFRMVYHLDKTTFFAPNERVASHNIGIRFNGEIKNARFKQ